MLLVLYLVMILIILKSAYNMKDTFGSLVCIGIFITLFSQFLINVGMNLGIMPVTGIPLPLVSYGGSSMISTLMLLGVFQSIWSVRR
jgi:rod shape determining protein RodA